MSEELKRALDSIHSNIVTSPKDWSKTPRDAWIYGIVCGWSNDSYKELSAKFRWEDVHIEQNKRFHRAYKEATHE